MEFHGRYDGFYGAFIHDPLASRPPSTRRSSGREALAVDVELAGRSRPARPSPTGAGVWGRPPNVDVAVEADADEFLDRFVERVGGLAAALAQRNLVGGRASGRGAAAAVRRRIDRMSQLAAGDRRRSSRSSSRSPSA